MVRASCLRLARGAAAAAHLLLLSPAWSAAPNMLIHDGAEGVSCRHFDTGYAIDWPGGHAHWVDAKGSADGSTPFDSQRIDLRGGESTHRWNVTALVKIWADRPDDNEGLLIQGSGGAQFHARESDSVDRRPSMRVVHGDGTVEFLGPAADASLDCSTQASVGRLPYLNIGPSAVAVMRFDLNRLRKGNARQVQRAELILSRTGVSAWAAGSLGIFRLTTPMSTRSSPQAGLAAGFSRDQGIERHPDVLFADRFEASALQSAWTRGDPRAMVAIEPGKGGPREPARLLRAQVPTGQNLGLDLRFDFKRQSRPEPEEAYLRYYLRLDPVWARAPDAGKLPGLAGTYGKAGWGGRAWDGQAGWSARGAFLKPPGADHPSAGRVMLGSYVYHSKSSHGFGDTLPWSGGRGAALVQPGQWVCVEQHLRLNTPGAEDGALRAWVDGHLVFERHNLRLRDSASLRIENAWFDVYLGGHEVARRDMPLQISHVVVARRYIGPMAP